MSRTRAATPAGRSRSTGAKGRSAARGGHPKKSAKAAKSPKSAVKPSSKGKTKISSKSRAKPSAKGKGKAAPKTTAKGKVKRARRAPAASKRRAPSRLRRTRAAARIRGAVSRISWRTRLAILVVLLAAGWAGYTFWLRDSSLVAVTDVEVVGVTTSDRAAIVGEITAAAEQMTTLNADPERIEEIAARFPTVAAVDVEPNFPHGMRIEVEQRPPRLFAAAGGKQVPVAADGTLLAGLEVPEDEGERLPVLELDGLPPGATLEGLPREQAIVAGSAPDPLLPLVEAIGASREYGIEIGLEGGVEVRFGSAARVDDKWAAAAAVLADPKLDLATYVDVRVPERAAVGGGA